jgi:hypothetical protein
MMTGNRISRAGYVFIISIVCALFVALLPSWTQAASLALPPRKPTPTTRPTAPQEPPVGGVIELHVRFDQTWPWTEISWQQVWAIVQWQDDWSDWHDVKGWQGTLDEVVNLEGRKLWWVAEKDLGTGPFRWVVYRHNGGKLLVTSEPFYMPSIAGKTMKVEVSLRP